MPAIGIQHWRNQELVVAAPFWIRLRCKVTIKTPCHISLLSKAKSQASIAKREVVTHTTVRLTCFGHADSQALLVSAVGAGVALARNNVTVTFPDTLVFFLSRQTPSEETL